MKTPTKEYMGDILNKLVEYKNDNEQLKKEVAERDKVIASQQNELENLKGAMQKLENNLRGRIDRLPPIQSSRGGKVESLEEPVKAFL
jgi:predicted nuclease with TOPRIM domain